MSDLGEQLTDSFSLLPSEAWVEKPSFGKPLEEHLTISGREIAFPIEACVTMLLECGMQEEVGMSTATCCPGQVSFCTRQSLQDPPSCTISTPAPTNLDGLRQWLSPIFCRTQIDPTFYREPSFVKKRGLRWL